MIQFKKVIVHNFGSYGHAELELQNKGFCLVSGQNNYIKDNALSNGSGKSFLWSAICYALTGETISGIKTNLKNINIEEQDCYVQLDFMYNKDFFSLIRTVTPKSDLKIFKNDIDLSGKGIRESEKKLQELIPELTKDLIASTIIIGQGMPNKFSSFSPSGRKELLEKLTKSDFMIEDLKTRIQARQSELSIKIREFEDSLLLTKNQLNGYLSNLDKIKNSLETQKQPDFDRLISEQLAKISLLTEELEQFNLAVTTLESQQEEANSKLLAVSDEKAKVSSEELTAYTTSYTRLSNDKTKLELDIANLNREIAKLQAIVDTCPTCGQHLPNVHKPDTSTQEALVQETDKKLSEVKDNITKCNKQHQEYIAQINSVFNDEITRLNAAASDIKQNLLLYRGKLTSSQAALETERNTYNKLVYDKQNWDSYVENQQREINQLEAEVARLTNLVAITSLAKEDFDQRLSIIKKMDQLIRRDFRGYLLTNIINYIDTRAKDYCNTVFGTRELSLSLNGNALDITYCGKQFDGLSGGEKQRVDLILQLAIRDLLTSYLGLSANILVLDEVTDFLDKKSCQAVMQLLEKELQTVESVFIISHHAEELELPVDSEIRVIKNEHGISELY
jgi:DNA repair exonuclease SbcCD ATPase subunit